VEGHTPGSGERDEPKACFEVVEATTLLEKSLPRNSGKYLKKREFFEGA